MKKIIIVSHTLEIGGAERALLGLLDSFDYEKYQVDLFLMRHEGPLLEYLPKQVNLLPEIKEYTALAVPILSVIKKGMFKIAADRALAKQRAVRYIKEHKLNKDNGVKLEYSHKYTVKDMPDISTREYDVVISFLTPHYFAAEKVKAKERIAWIHTDYSYFPVNYESEKKMWGKYEHIISISEACTEGFISKFPELKDRVVLIENIISPAFIKSSSKMLDVSEEMNSGGIKLLSIGRFSYQKNFDSIPNICRRLLDAGLEIKWYIIGFGSEEEKIRNEINLNNVSENVIILGKKNNPYPYIAECDVYVQPSRYEGKCVAVREAQILGKPVIITDYPTASSQLKDCFDGCIVPLDNERCAETVYKLLTNQQALFRLKENLKECDYSNADEINKLYRLIN